MKKKLKKLINSIMKKNVFLRKIIRKVHYIKYNLKYNLITKRVKVDEKLIIFACFNGRSYCDSPKALYKQMLEDKSFEEYKFIWAFNDIENYTFLEENKNTQLVKIGSKEYLKSLGRAKYWIFNYKIPDYIYPKGNQIFVQCWHGTPLKRLGCDLQHFNNAMNSLTEIKKRYHMEAEKFSYFLSPSKFATEKFISTWDLKQIGKENIMIEEGYPRNDFLMNYTQKDIESIKEKLNLKDCNKKIILYAPTYRDNQHTSGVGYTYETKVTFDNLRESLGDEYVILFREHWLVAQSFNFENYKDFVIDVSNYDDINELYVISDLLITDYSSVFFDYANLKRPIIFYMYDLEDYRDNIRGFYLDIADLPGKIIKTENELIEEIRLATTQFKYDKKYENFNKKFNYLDDGQASKRVIDKIFKSNLGGKI